MANRPRLAKYAVVSSRGRIRQEDVAPLAGPADVADVQRAVGAEALEEDARLDVAFGARRQDVEGDLAEFLILVRQQDDHHVGRRGGGHGREQRHRPQHAEDADAAGLQGDELAVGGQPAEPDQDPEQQRHRDRDAERRRQQGRQNAHDRDPVDALRDQLLALRHDGRNLEQEGEDQQAEAEGEQNLPNDIPVENPEHQWPSFRLAPMTRVAILWHMHQPFYEDLVTHEHILPWVRLHALKDYYGMVALLREFPDVRVTFNLVPSLLVQLEAFAADRAHDRFLELSLKPADDLTDADVVFILENFFHAQRQRMIEAYPRYAELLAHRGALASAADAHAAARRFSRDDLRDLQVWHKLAWIDPFYLDGDTRVRALVAKDRGFTEEDKAVAAGRRAGDPEPGHSRVPRAPPRGVRSSSRRLRSTIRSCRCCATRTSICGRIPTRESRASDSCIPRTPSSNWTRAVALHQRLFGQRAGRSLAVGGLGVRRDGAAGRGRRVHWMATDELILARTLGITLRRDGHGHLEQPELMYRALRP